MQLEVDTGKIDQLENLLNTILGQGVHITKPVNYDSSRVDINHMAFHVYNYTHPKILKAKFVEILKTSKSILEFVIDALDPSMELFNEDVPDINFH